MQPMAASGKVNVMNRFMGVVNGCDVILRLSLNLPVGGNEGCVVCEFPEWDLFPVFIYLADGL